MGYEAHLGWFRVVVGKRKEFSSEAWSWRGSRKKEVLRIIHMKICVNMEFFDLDMYRNYLRLQETYQVLVSYLKKNLMIAPHFEFLGEK